MNSDHRLDDRKSWNGDEDLEELSFIFKTYKIRFFGLAVVALSNIASSLNWLSVATVPDFSNAFFNNVGYTAINWFSNVFMLAYIVAGPLSSFTYEKLGIKAGVSFCLLYTKYLDNQNLKSLCLLSRLLLVVFCKQWVLGYVTFLPLSMSLIVDLL